MSDEQHKQTFIANQDEALGLYLDSLLSPIENEQQKDEQSTAIDQSDSTPATSQTNEAETEQQAQEKILDKQSTTESLETDGIESHTHQPAENKIQAAKDFLKASKQRQQNKLSGDKVVGKVSSEQPSAKEKAPEQQIKQPVITPEPVKPEPIKSEVTVKPEAPVKPEVIVKEKDSTIEATNSEKAIDKNLNQIITKGPVSPKPRPKPETVEQDVAAEKHNDLTTTVSKLDEPNITQEVAPKSSLSSIIFSETDKDGQVSEQVLIPRSQKLEKLKKDEQASDNKSSQPKPSIAVAKSIVSDKSASDKLSSDSVVSSQINNANTEQTTETPKRKDFSKLKQYVEKITKEKPVETQPAKPEEKIQLSKPEPEPEKPLFKPSSFETEKPVQEVVADNKPNEPSINLAQNETTTVQLQEKHEAKEAPNIDLSLFLPKIKTLSDEEIAQQIEALTQAAVSQAQMESDLAHAAQLEQQKITKKEVTAEETDGVVRNIDNAPDWAVPDFQVLLFAVAGLKLAVPLNELNGVLEWGDEYLTELPGHAPWYLGLIQNLGRNIPVIDTMQQVVPQNRWPADHLSNRNFKHIILIDNSNWGLACETVLEVITLKTDEVKWRSERTKRRWLLGTVIDHMCALLDSSEFASMLKTGDDSLLN